MTLLTYAHMEITCVSGLYPEYRLVMPTIQPNMPNPNEVQHDDHEQHNQDDADDIGTEATEEQDKDQQQD